MRYLGVPLLSTKLKAIDCKIMEDKITARTKSWTNRDLTYVGRAQLIKTILFSMQTYWSSFFIIPKKVIKEVEAILRAFLWSGPNLKKTGSKVFWEHICSPKHEGGLGFKSMQLWNQAAIANHIWFFIFGGEQSMWYHWQCRPERLDCPNPTLNLVARSLSSHKKKFKKKLNKKSKLYCTFSLNYIYIKKKTLVKALYDLTWSD